MLDGIPFEVSPVFRETILLSDTLGASKILTGEGFRHLQWPLIVLPMTVVFIFWTVLFSPGLAWTTNPSPEEICDDEADRFVLNGKWQKAIELHQEIVKKSPEFALVHSHLCFAFGQIERYDQEIREYRKAISLGFKNAEMYYNLGIALGENFHDYSGAIAAFKEAVQLKPTEPEFHYNLGFAYLLNKEEGAAEKELREALLIEPKHLQARISLGSLYADRKEFEKAQKEWEVVLKIGPSNVEALANLKWLRGITRQTE